MKNPGIFRFAASTGILACALVCGAAQAQSQVPDHPRVNEVNDRLGNQQARIQNGVADGQINARQAARDEQHDANIAHRESVDEARHGGHLTQGEDRRLNRSLDHNSQAIHRQR